MMFHYFVFHYVTCPQPHDLPCACGTFKKPVSSIGSVGSLVDFISLSNKSFKSLTCVGKVQCCPESILFQRFDVYFCFPTLNVHPSSKKATRNCAVRHFTSCKKLAVSFLWEREGHEYIFCTKIWQTV